MQQAIRQANIRRNTAETQITCTLTIEGEGRCEIETGCGFLNHMLELFAKHGRFNLVLHAKGDTDVDDHHTVEDTGIVMGRAFSQALGNRAGIVRYGSFLLPMDEALVQTALDVSGRGYVACGLCFATEKIGGFDTQLVQEFMLAFARELGLTLHLVQLAGQNSHHIAEAAFKGLGRALAQAVAINPQAPGEIPSSKGTLL